MEPSTRPARGGSCPPALRLPADVSGWIGERAARGYPDETCGLLVGTVEGGRVRVVRAEAAGNLDRERARDRYALDPGDFVRIDAAARADGLDIVGIWHSHPDHPARPSDTDLERAWNGYGYLIASVGRDGVREIRSWWLVDGEFVEQAIVENDT